MKTIIYFLHNTKFSAYFQWKTKTLTILFSYRFEQTKQVCEGKKIGSSFVWKELPMAVFMMFHRPATLRMAGATCWSGSWCATAPFS